MRNWDYLRVFRMPDGAAGGGSAGGESGQAAAGQTGEAQAPAEAQATNTQEQAAADPKARAQAYREMTRGEYKDLYDADVQRIVQQRLRSAKGAEESLGKIQTGIDLLKKAYGTEDLDALNKAIMDDGRFYEQEAMKRGMDVETFKQLTQKDVQLEAMKRAQAEAREREEQARQVMAWRAQETELKKTFPDFDLETEIDASGGELFQMLRRGVSLEHAYLALHMDDIVGSTVQSAMQRGAQKTLESVRANGLRPAENGNGDGPGVKQAVDLSKLTPQQMRDIERRLMRGEVITSDSFRTQ